MPDIFRAEESNTIPGTKKYGLGARYETVAERLLKERKLGQIKTFHILPGRIRFENQEQREKIILLLRQHWVTQVRWIILGIMGIGVPVIFVFVPILDFLPANYQLMTLVLW